MRTARRRRAQRLGRVAEWLAVLRLRLAGYRVIARGVGASRGSGAGEIDVVVRRGRLVAFVEIKLRPDLDQAAFAIEPRQRRRIERNARAFLAHRPHLAECDIRFDAVLLSPWRLPRHLPDAWRIDA